MMPAYTTDLYRRGFHYGKEADSSIRLFAAAMREILNQRLWEKGWVDQVHADTRTAPTLWDFIESPVPRGLGLTVNRAFALLDAAQALGEGHALITHMMPSNTLAEDDSKAAP
jgi:hypothetical protein